MKDIYLESKALFDTHVFECKDKLKRDCEDYEYQNNQMDIKVSHSYRVQHDMEIIFNNFLYKEGYVDLAKVVGLMHDIGRFRQMLETGTYKDVVSFEKMKDITDHGDYGVKILFDDKLITTSNIDSRYFLVLYNTIKYHGKATLPNHLNYQLSKDDKMFLMQDVESFLNKFGIKDIAYLKFLSLYAQAIRDADKIDIYYQHINNDFPVVMPYITSEVHGESPESIANYWGISSSEIKNYNHLEQNDLSNYRTIKIPIKNIEPSKFTVPDWLMQQFIDGSVPPLKVLLKERWYNFTTGALVRLNFLRDMNFISSLINLRDKDLLNRIYQMYPEQYKLLVKDLFEFAQKELIERQIKKNHGNMYVEK